MDNIYMMSEAVQFIEENLTKPISVKNIADRIGYSLYYFIRLFNTITKHSPYDYLMRRRLSEGAKDLIRTDKKIIDIAFDYQFNSHETFSRAFKKMFGMLPNQAKKNKLNGLILKTCNTYEYLKHINSYNITKPKLVWIDELHLVGISKVTKKKEIFDNAFWQNFYKNISLIQLNKKPEFVFYIRFFPNNKKINLYLHMIGIDVRQIHYTPYVFTAKIIEKGEYLQFYHKGSGNTKQYTLDYIYQSWLPKSDCRLKRHFELSKVQVDTNYTNGLATVQDILIPL